MIENELKRIADALEKMTELVQRPAVLVQAEPPPRRDPVNPSFEDLAKQVGEKAPPANEPTKPKRGRPPKAAPAPAPEPAAEPKDVLTDLPDPTPEDPMDFLSDEDTSPAPTREDVRAALIAYQKAHGGEKARKLLKTVGGADTLISLAEDKFRAVIAATR